MKRFRKIGVLMAVLLIILAAVALPAFAGEITHSKGGYTYTYTEETGVYTRTKSGPEAAPETISKQDWLDAGFEDPTGGTGTSGITGEDGLTYRLNTDGTYTKVDGDGNESAATKEEYEAAREYANKSSENKETGAFVRYMFEQATGMNAASENSGTTVNPADPAALLDTTFRFFVIGTPDGGESIVQQIIDSVWYQFLVGICFVVMVCHFFFDYGMSLSMEYQATPERLAKPIAKLVGAFIFILTLPWFLKLAAYVGQAALMALESTDFLGGSTAAGKSLIGQSGVSAQDIEDKFIEGLGFRSGSGPLAAIMNAIPTVEGIFILLVPFFISWLTNFGLFFTILTRLVEMAIMVILAPLACTDMYKMGEGRTHGAQYLMRFCGVCFQGFAILAVYFTVSYISGLFVQGIFPSGMGASMKEVGTLTLTLSVLNLVKLVTVLKAGQYAREAISG